MTALVNCFPPKHRILIVDDEPDVITLTRLSLKGFEHNGRKIEFLECASGAAAVETMRANPDVALVLLDVVMETNSAGLDACRRIREEVCNPLVRIVLRTGQPGHAPERQTIDDYDIDGYLPKADLTSDRLYTSVRTALKAWEELVELDRYRACLKSIHEAVVTLRAYEPLEKALQRILAAAVEICPTDLAVLNLETFDPCGNPRIYRIHLAAQLDDVRAGTEAAAVATRVRRAEDVDGHVEPLSVHRELGFGFIYLRGATPDPLAATMLSLLAAHAGNAFHAMLSYAMLSSQGLPGYDAMTV